MVHVLSRSDAYRADGTRRTEQEVLAEFGPIGSRLVFLQDAAHRLEEELAYEVHYPPKLFLAYKWDDEVHNAWVRSVAEKLAANGWDVVFDAFRSESVDPLVEDFVARLLTCRVFAAVITPAYIEHAVALNSNRPTWVFDEFQIALRASDDLLQCVGLWHSGDERPPLPFIIDLRGEDDAGVQQLLEKHLRYDGPKLGPDEGAGLVSLLRDTLGRSDAATVARLREGLDRYPFVAALWRRVVCILRDRGDLADALQAAEQAVANVHVWDQRLSRGKGALTGSVSVTDNAPGSPQTLPLTGTGTFMQFSPASWRFGTQPVGTHSFPKKIALTNKGHVAVNIAKVSITGSNAADFTQTNTCKSLASGARCFITVTFTPRAKGKRAAAVSVSDNGGGSPQTAPLNGAGT